MTLTDPHRPPPWGIPATIAWVLFAFLVSMIAAAGLFAAWQGDRVRSLAVYDGEVVAVSALVSFPVQVAILAWAVRLRGWTPSDYFALAWPKRGELIVGVICVVVIDLAFNALLYVTGHDIVTPFQIEAYQTAQKAGALLWLTFAIVVVYRGLARPGREIHVIVIIAAIWALLHIQYDWIGMAQIFALGLALGWFRWASGSTTLSIVMHILINLEAMIETAIKVEFLS
jgi:uncharacterized protein